MTLSKPIRRFTAMLLTSFVLGSLPVKAHAEQPTVSAEACVLMDAESGTVIYEKNPDSRMLIASTTKIMTALVALEHCSPDDVVEIKREWTAVEGSSMGLAPGEF
ncbi:MAG: D-alanyl-D-alanine carboxypeptidase, partial [Oscillospiraceae bacterium]|nr:D-alanyl-D-alanine carboxypeptidase [Oscillospiraceae bacterium]